MHFSCHLRCNDQIADENHPLYFGATSFKNDEIHHHIYDKMYTAPNRFSSLHFMEVNGKSTHQKTNFSSDSEILYIINVVVGLSIFFTLFSYPLCVYWHTFTHIFPLPEENKKATEAQTWNFICRIVGRGMIEESLLRSLNWL